ncbi:hypothetical protein P3T76_015362 [Phytophthora citrophthora]|uniref:Uncharacterized protein n=1 Tax=Phytophthora citrophthora TaxID=4793 RepID=A0AAD9FZB5_9STRA|nr:hypothetical protein P3T76_015362 [Phytophthora citrophthora]
MQVASSRQQKAGVSAGLSSHSFRRGSGQHANANSSLSPQRIFDRGKTRHLPVFLTQRTKTKRCQRCLATGNASTPQRLQDFVAFLRFLFASSLKLCDSNLTMNPQGGRASGCLVDTSHTSTRGIPRSRIWQCLFSLQVTMYELLAWSVELTQQGLISHQNAVIAHLIEANKTQTDRIAELEKRMDSGGTGRDSAHEDHQMAVIADSQALLSKGRFARHQRLRQQICFERYTKTPRLWEVYDDRQYKSQSKPIVTFMKLLLPHGLPLTQYADRMMQAGNTAQHERFSSCSQHQAQARVWSLERTP